MRKSGAYYISTAPGKHQYFDSYTEAKRWVKDWMDLHPKSKGAFQIYPVDRKGYQSKADGRTAFGAGCKATR